MSRDRALVRSDAALAPLEQLVEVARASAQDSRASSTRKAYLSDFASFEAQCARGFEGPKGHPAITTVMTGIRRRHGTSPQQKAPVIDEVLAAFVATLDDELVGLRDRALLTLGWF